MLMDAGSWAGSGWRIAEDRGLVHRPGSGRDPNGVPAVACGGRGRERLVGAGYPGAWPGGAEHGQGRAADGQRGVVCLARQLRGWRWLLAPRSAGARGSRTERPVGQGERDTWSRGPERESEREWRRRRRVDVVPVRGLLRSWRVLRGRRPLGRRIRGRREERRVGQSGDAPDQRLLRRG